MTPTINRKTFISLRPLVLFILFVGILIYSKNNIAQNSGLVLTAEESDWIVSNPELVVANELDWPPFDFAEDGEPRGFSIDLINLIADKTGLQLRFVNGYTWAELMEKFKIGEIDILPAFYLNEERKSFIAYTDSYASNPSILVTHKGIDDVSKLEDLNGRSIAVISGYATAIAIENVSAA